MKTYWIEIDEIVWKYLQKKAEPFIDTPNTVLQDILFGKKIKKASGFSPPVLVSGLPKSLSLILEIIYEIERNGYTRTKATKVIANRKEVAPRTLISKYCNYLGKKAREIDVLLKEPGYDEFRRILKEKNHDYNEIIDMYFDTMLFANN